MKITAYPHPSSRLRHGPPNETSDSLAGFRAEVRHRFGVMDHDITELKTDLAQLKTDVMQLKFDFGLMAGQIEALADRFSDLKWMMALLATLMVGGFAILACLMIWMLGGPPKLAALLGLSSSMVQLAGAAMMLLHRPKACWSDL
ncbi:hypothetical protein [Roseateles sp. YR242]|uniref:hypothetical protein n=1 Tax=Roseateles sp. YR242 TaxID=1855305 RepID=UPI001160D7A4|nr:hypothetical protein [Roseateles sp. YR242]